MASLDQLTDTLGRHRAKHLLYRATYAVTPSLIEAYSTKTASEAVTDLFAFQTPVPEEPVDDFGELCIPTPLNPTAETNHYSHHAVFSWWMSNAVKQPTLQWKLAFFLHGIWICDADVRINNFGYFWDYLALLNYYSDKSVRELATQMTMNNRMLFYLNNNLNTVSGPNENYGREVMELFTITKGPQVGPGDYTTYTEADVAQASRVLTGFTNSKHKLGANDPPELYRLYVDNISPVTGICQGRLSLSDHDTGDKTFSSNFGNQVITGATTEEGMWDELNDFFDMIYAQDWTAKVLAERIYRYFVGRNITPEIADDIITPLSVTLKDNNYDLKIAVSQLLASEHFFDADDDTEGDEIIGGMIKSPLDLYLTTLSMFDFPLYDPETESEGHLSFFSRSGFYSVKAKLEGTGGELFSPSNVNGYPANTEDPLYDMLWVSTSKLQPRYKNMYTYFFPKKYDKTDPRSLELPTFVINNTTSWFSDPSDAYALVDEFLDLAFQFEVTSERLDFFRQSLLGSLSIINWQHAWNNFISDPDNPVYEIEVRTGLDRLVTAIVTSAEYQLK